MQLAYNDDITGLTTVPQFNGNISAITWKNSEELSGHSYTFNYDNANRITKGDHFNGITATTEFDLNKVSYDKNGNIYTLIRYGASGLIDNLTYTYTDASSNYTNQLQQVDDATGNTVGFADVPGLDYAYDNNGNLIEDYNKGIENISYNYLNLPQRIWFGNGDSITYIYDAAGVKHAKLIDGSETGDRYYIGNMEYNQTQTLEFIHTDEGRIRYNGVDYAYDYYLKDHLGNIRVSFTESSTVPGQAEALQVDNYYPFGMRFNQAPILQVEENNYLYNGKELQKNYGLDWYDYGWRYFDPALARFTTIDPLAEIFDNNSPYHYALNNPVRYRDFMGMGAEETGKDEEKKPEEEKKKMEDEVETVEIADGVWFGRLPGEESNNKDDKKDEKKDDKKDDDKKDDEKDDKKDDSAKNKNSKEYYAELREFSKENGTYNFLTKIALSEVGRYNAIFFDAIFDFLATVGKAENSSPKSPYDILENSVDSLNVSEHNKKVIKVYLKHRSDKFQGKHKK